MRMEEPGEVRSDELRERLCALEDEPAPHTEPNAESVHRDSENVTLFEFAPGYIGHRTLVVSTTIGASEAGVRACLSLEMLCCLASGNVDEAKLGTAPVRLAAKLGLGGDSKIYSLADAWIRDVQDELEDDHRRLRAAAMEAGRKVYQIFREAMQMAGVIVPEIWIDRHQAVACALPLGAAKPSASDSTVVYSA